MAILDPTPSPSESVLGVVTDPVWTWEATATIIQAVATVAALGGLAVTFYFSYRAERRERRRAEDEAKRSDAAAERSEHAAALSIDTMERIAEAIESLAAKGLGSAGLVAAAPPTRVRWSLTHATGDVYLLSNVGDADAYSVDVSADASLVMRDRPSGVTVRGGEAVRFFAVPYGNVTDRTITVEWANVPDEGASRDVWRYPLPPRPRRR